MSRRRQPPHTNFNPKSKKRPRRYHHGRAQGKVNEEKIVRALPAFDRAEEDRAEVAALAVENRRAISDWQALLDGIARVGSVGYAPFAMRGGAARSARRAHNPEVAGSNPVPATQ